MHISAPVFVASVVLIGLVTWAWKVLNWIWLRPKKLEKCLKEQGLAGSSYTLFIGDTKTSSRMAMGARAKPISLTDDVSMRVLPFLHQAMKNYGKLCYTWVGTTPRLMVMNPEHIKETVNRVNDFPKPQMNPLVKLSTGVASYNGEKWAQQRRILNPAFYLEKLKNMVPAFYQSCCEMIRELDKLVLKDGSAHEVDVWPLLQNLASDVISRTAFGSSYNEGRVVFELLCEQAKLSQLVLQTVYIPGWRFVPTKTNKRIQEVDFEISVILKDIISKREKAIHRREDPDDDLLGLLLESNSQPDQGHRMTIQEVIEECKLFHFAGQETTAVLLVWTMVLLGQHQEWQARARDEVIRVFHHEKPDFVRLNHLKIVTMILYEVLRLYPPLPAINRTTRKEMKLGDMTIPAGTIISFPIILIHRDTELWGPDAAEFRPERFAEGVSKATTNQASFMPFGLGPRICIGQNFALMEAKMALAMILQRFSFELSASYAHAPHIAITLHPQFGVQLNLRKL